MKRQDVSRSERSRIRRCGRVRFDGPIATTTVEGAARAYVRDPDGMIGAVDLATASMAWQIPAESFWISGCDSASWLVADC